MKLGVSATMLEHSYAAVLSTRRRLPFTGRDFDLQWEAHRDQQWEGCRSWR
jgi:hypothetical protein